MESYPLVSIIIPVFNGSDYMKEAIDSALSQTYPNIEVLVINDGSDDDGRTAEIARGYGDKIRYFEKENGGVSSALNLGIREMKGTFFSWLSHDDVYESRKVEAEVFAYQAQAIDDLLIYCHDSKINVNSEEIFSPKKVRSSLPDCKVLPNDLVLHDMLTHGVFNGCGFLIPRKVFQEAGLFNEELRYAQDAFMWYQIFMRGFSLWIIPDVLVKNRIHKNQQTQKNRERFGSDCFRISQLILPQLDTCSSEKIDFVYEYTLRNAMLCNYSAVRNCICFLKSNRKTSLFKVFMIRLYCGFGWVREQLRNLYYRVLSMLHITGK